MSNIQKNLVLLMALYSFPIHSSTCNCIQGMDFIVQANATNSSEIKNWRNSYGILEATRKQNGNVAGLSQLWLSGAGVIHAGGFKEVKKRIRHATNNQVQTIIDLDLREESHGYLNGNAITLTNEDNSLNRGKTRNKTLKDEQKWLASLRDNKIINPIFMHSHFKKKDFSQGKSEPVHSVIDEKTLVESLKIEYVRLTISDHMAPNSTDVIRFIQFVKNMKPHTWLHVHCQGGKGRTTTFMTMYDMLLNADKASLSEIVHRQASVPPFYNMLQTTRKHPRFTIYYKERAEFIRKFYLFSDAYLKDKSLEWGK